MAASKTLSAAIADARKIVGDKASIPKPKADTDAVLDQIVARFHKWQSALTDLYTDTVVIDKAFKSYRYGMEQNAAVYGKADFGLDEKSKDDAAKIKQAQKILDDFFAQSRKAADDNAKSFGDLYDRVLHVMQGTW
ncbi:MAG TPA: hypothetical protein VKS60_12920 [Stellaceae bacterium]|nr:hypothetical protein [Stellaceae bacterium]